MIIAIIIILYILQVFLNRWLNKILYKTADWDITPVAWFTPVACTIAFIIIYFIDNDYGDNWFTGKYWKK